MSVKEGKKLNLGGPLEMSLKQVVSAKNTVKLPCCLAGYY